MLRFVPDMNARDAILARAITDNAWQHASHADRRPLRFLTCALPAQPAPNKPARVGRARDARGRFLKRAS